MNDLMKSLIFLSTSVILCCQSEKSFASQMFLNQLVDYDPTIRPHDFKNKAQNGPTEISIDLFIQQIIRSDFHNRAIEIKVVLMEMWLDQRLAIGNGSLEIGRESKDPIKIHPFMSRHVWKPKTSFLNEISSDVYKDSEEFLIDTSVGQVVHRGMFRVRLQCGGRQEGLRRFPFDYLFCPLGVYSFGSTDQEIRYIWWQSKERIGVKSMRHELEYIELRSMISYFCGWRTRQGFVDCLGALLIFRRMNGWLIMAECLLGIIFVGASWIPFWATRSFLFVKAAISTTSFIAVVLLDMFVFGSFPVFSSWTWLNFWIRFKTGLVGLALVQSGFIIYLQLRRITSMKRYSFKANLNAQMANTEFADDEGVIIDLGIYDKNDTIEIWSRDRARFYDRLARAVFPLVFLLVTIPTFFQLLSFSFVPPITPQ